MRWTALMFLISIVVSMPLYAAFGVMEKNGNILQWGDGAQQAFVLCFAMVGILLSIVGHDLDRKARSINIY